MKVVPLWQPWASLVAVGAKRIETRSWPAPPSILGARVAIHATKTQEHLGWVRTEPFHRRLREARDAGLLVLTEGELPLGAIVATVVVEASTPITEASAAELEARDPDEYSFGNYGPDRWAWRLTELEPLTEPVPFRASQGISEIPDAQLGYRPPQGALL